MRMIASLTFAGVWLALWIDPEAQQVHPALQSATSVSVGHNDQVLQTEEADSSLATWACVTHDHVLLYVSCAVVLLCIDV